MGGKHLIWSFTIWCRKGILGDNLKSFFSELRLKKIYSKVKVIYYLKYSGTDNGLTFTSPNWETSPRLESVSMKILTWHKTSIFFSLILDFMFSFDPEFSELQFQKSQMCHPNILLHHSTIQIYPNCLQSQNLHLTS